MVRLIGGMKMKRILAITFAMVLLLQVVSAQTMMTVSEALPTQSIKPGDALYGLDRGLEKIQLAFAFNHRSRANLRLELAEERLGELSQLDPEEADKYRAELLEEYENELAEAESEGAEIEDAQDRREFNERAEARLERHVQVMEAVRTRIMEDDNPNNDNAEDGLDRAIENSNRVREKVRVRIGETSIDELETEYGREFAYRVRDRIETENQERENHPVEIEDELEDEEPGHNGNGGRS